MSGAFAPCSDSGSSPSLEILDGSYSVSSQYAGTPAISTATMTDGVAGGSSYVGTGNSAAEWVKCLHTAATLAGVKVQGGTDPGVWGPVALFLNGAAVQTTVDGTTWVTQATVAGVTDDGTPVIIPFTPVPGATGVQLASTGYLATSMLIPLKAG